MIFVVYVLVDNFEIVIFVVVFWVYIDYGVKYIIINEIGREVLDKYFELKLK